MIRPERLTIKAQEALRDAGELARARGNPVVNDAHLLAVLLAQDEGVVRPLLQKAGLNLTAVAEAVEREVSRFPTQSGGGAEPSFSRELQRIFDRADAEAAVGEPPQLLGREIDFAPSPDDFQRVLAGLTKAGEVLFAAGAKVVMPTVFDYFEFRSPQELQKLPALIKDPADIMMGGGHPEGGNTISRRAELGVIGSDFRVRGADNLFLCDASVFPTASGVNPQLTVMALAHYAAPGVAAAR